MKVSKFNILSCRQEAVRFDVDFRILTRADFDMVSGLKFYYKRSVAERIIIKPSISTINILMFYHIRYQFSIIKGFDIKSKNHFLCLRLH